MLPFVFNHFTAIFCIQHLPFILVVVASLVAEDGLQGVWASVVAARRLGSCDSQA